MPTAKEQPTAVVQRTAADIAEIKNDILQLRAKGTLDKKDLVTASKWLVDMFKEGKLTNLQHLLPFFQLKGNPYTLKNHYMFGPMFDSISPMRQLWRCCRQVGKCIPYSEIGKVRKADGSPLTLEELRVGTELLSLDDSNKIVPRSIVHVEHNGPKAIVEVRTRLGSIFKVTPDHPLLTPEGYIPAGELSIGSRLASVRRGGVFGDISVDPRRIAVTGYMLGDGSCSAKQPELTVGAHNTDVFADVATMFTEGPDYTIYTSASRAPRIYWRSACPVRQWLREDGLIGKHSWDKFIPSWVYQLSMSDTIRFMECLWAADGTCTLQSNGPDISYTSASRRLAEGVRAILNKLGMAASFKPRKTDGRPAWVVRVADRESQRRFHDIMHVPGKTSPCVPKQWNTDNRDTIPVEFAGLLQELFRNTTGKPGTSMRAKGIANLKLRYSASRAKLANYLRVAEELNLQNEPAYKELYELLHGDVYWDTVQAVTPCPAEDTFDVEMGGEHNFVFDGILSHNTQNMAGSEMIIANTTPHLNTLICTPLFEQVKRVSQNYFGTLVQDFMFPELMQDETCAKSVLMRTYKNQAKQYFSYAFLNADRIRGIAADRCNQDEIQDFDASLLPVIEQCLGGTEKWGAIRKTGTPKTFDNIIQEEWDYSSQAEWATPCSCGKWNIACIEMDLLQMIGKTTTICAKCGKDIDPRMGCWIHAFPDRIATYAGYHVSQPIHPYYFANKERWYELLYNRSRYTDAKFRNECLGESCDSSERLVTLRDIHAACKDGSNLGRHNTIEQAIQLRGGYTMCAMGIDWGGGGGESTTSSTVVTLAGLRPGSDIVDVLYTVRLRTTLRPEEEARVVVQLFKELKPNFVAHDYTGAGNIRESTLIQLCPPIAQCLMPFTYGASMTKLVITYHQATGGSRSSYYIDKPRSLMIMAAMLRYNKISLPSYKSCKHVVDDLLAMYEDHRERAAGSDLVLVQKVANKSDDFAHSLNFACSGLWYAAQIYPDFTELLDIRMAQSDLDSMDPAQELSIADWEELPPDDRG